MKLIIAFVLALSTGCAGTTKKPTQPPAGADIPTCPDWGCDNGTRSTGTVDDSAPRVESVTLSSGEPAQTR